MELIGNENFKLRYFFVNFGIFVPFFCFCKQKFTKIWNKFRSL